MANTFIFDDDEEETPALGSGNSNDDQEPDEEQESEEGEGNNRNFLMILGIVGGGLALLVACIVLFALFRPGGFLNNNQANLAATNTFGTQIAQTTQTQEAILQASPTFEPTITATETITTTPVVVVFATEEPTNTVEPDLATAQANQTLLAATDVAATTTATFAAVGGTDNKTPQAKGTATLNTPKTDANGNTVTPSTHIPQTGFADEVGLPALAIITIVLLAVIFFARRLRSAQAAN